MYNDSTILKQQLDFCSELPIQVFNNTAREFIKHIEFFPLPYEQILCDLNLTRECWMQKPTKSLTEHLLYVQNYASPKLSMVSCLLFSESRVARKKDIPKHFKFKVCGNELCCNPAHMLILPQTMSKEIRSLCKKQKERDLLTDFYELVDNHNEVSHLEIHPSILRSEEDLVSRLYMKHFSTDKDKDLQELITDTQINFKSIEFNMMKRILNAIYPKIMELDEESRIFIAKDLAQITKFIVNGGSNNA